MEIPLVSIMVWWIQWWLPGFLLIWLWIDACSISHYVLYSKVGAFHVLSDFTVVWIQRELQEIPTPVYCASHPHPHATPTDHAFYIVLQCLGGCRPVVPQSYIMFKFWWSLHLCVHFTFYSDVGRIWTVHYGHIDCKHQVGHRPYADANHYDFGVMITIFWSKYWHFMSYIQWWKSSVNLRISVNCKIITIISVNILEENFDFL